MKSRGGEIEVVSGPHAHEWEPAPEYHLAERQAYRCVFPACDFYGFRIWPRLTAREHAIAKATKKLPESVERFKSAIRAYKNPGPPPMPAGGGRAEQDLYGRLALPRAMVVGQTDYSQYADGGTRVLPALDDPDPETGGPRT